jgi:hypothetical protein
MIMRTKTNNKKRKIVKILNPNRKKYIPKLISV